MLNKTLGILRSDCIAEKNTCVNYHNGYCIKLNEHCPSMVKYDDKNNNNVPCDLAGYKPNQEKK